MEWLDEFADAGGAPDVDGTSQYYAVDAGGGPAELTEVLRSITVGLADSCRLQPVDSIRYPDSQYLNVAIDCRLVPAADSENWVLDGTTSPPTVELLGEYCEQFRNGAQRVDIIVQSCPPVP